ncbi:MAG TPA: hypothetical protein PKX15_09230 [Bacteroidales bacterium]|nr:hypothetical protein [Bacteroidales bacterium]
MELTNTTIVKSVNARDGVRVFFRHEDAEGNIYGPYIIHRPTLTGLHDVLANHRQRLEEQHNYVPDPEDEKDALIEMLLQYDPSIIKDVLDLSDKEVSDMKGLLENKKAARESDLKKEAEIKP